MKRRQIAHASLAKKQRAMVILGGLLVAVALVLYWLFGVEVALLYLLVLCAAELLAYLMVRFIGIPNGFFATERHPQIAPDIVNRFADHGYDSELGWVRKANSSKLDSGCQYVIDEHGSRKGYQEKYTGTLVSTYGDSYTFCRECEDSETWQYYLGDRLKSKVLNYGVGNYGFDQSLIRLKREFPNCPTPVVIIGVVPQTIARILSVWKHYNEHGNTLAFKPRFKVVDGQLVMIENPISSLDKYYQLDSLLPDVQDNDYYYSRRFVRESLRFPFLLSLIYNYRRLYVMFLKVMRSLSLSMGFDVGWWDSKIVHANKSEGAWQSAQLYNNLEAVELLSLLVDEFIDYSHQKDFLPILLIMPMKEDLIYIKQSGNYYAKFLDKISSKLTVIDLAGRFVSEDCMAKLFRRWHYSPYGNKLVADEVNKVLAWNGLKEGATGQELHVE
jgi:hypothetical protein